MRHHQIPFLNLFLVFGLLVQSFAPLWWIPRPATATAATTAALATPRARSPLNHAPTSNHFADVNGDQRVDQHDLALLGQVWNCATGDACYTAALDFNSDGLIDLFDLASVGNEYDIEPPTITIASPSAGAVLTGPTITVQGTAADSHTIPQILVNGTAATLTPISGGVNFSAVITVTNGSFPLHVAAVDAIGQTSGESRLVVIDGEGPFITVQEPPHRQAIYTVRPTVALGFVDLATAVEPATAQITLTDEGGTTADITSLLSINASGANGTLNFD
ncbi:MAG: hypothetical protein KDD89_15830, partial [Anaerolineales bacterium]|nr:hypothetical protein [Anaerolineales bacterium]